MAISNVTSSLDNESCMYSNNSGVERCNSSSCISFSTVMSSVVGPNLLGNDARIVLTRRCAVG